MVQWQILLALLLAFSASAISRSFSFYTLKLQGAQTPILLAPLPLFRLLPSLSTPLISPKPS
jgi:hypothetical protein